MQLLTLEFPSFDRFTTVEAKKIERGRNKYIVMVRLVCRKNVDPDNDLIVFQR